jgi:transcription antitermination factor NusG
MRTFRLGERVRIRAGAFQSFTGRIKGSNQALMLLKVEVDIFGRMHPVKVKFSEAEKIEFAKDEHDTEER